MLKNEILQILEQKISTIVTGGQLANQLNVSRNAIWKSIHVLQKEGVQIISIPNVGYKLLDTNDTLSKYRINSNLKTSFIGKELKILPTIPSTNQYLKEINHENIENGYVIIANEQTKGRGRKSREFISIRDEGIYLSLLLKINGQHCDIRLLTICSAIAVTNAIKNICKINTTIKWVNDIYYKNKKICGILTEAILSGELQELDSVIIGIGINTGNIPLEIKDFATSIKKETGKSGIRNELIAELLNQFEKIYLDYINNNNIKNIIQDYEKKLFIKNQQVTIINPNSEYLATVIGIDETGALIVKNNKGVIQHISTGEIKLS